MSFSSLTQGVVEDHDIRPADVRFPVRGFGNEAIADVALLLGVDEIFNVVAFFQDLPGNVSDEARY